MILISVLFACQENPEPLSEIANPASGGFGDFPTGLTVDQLTQTPGAIYFEDIRGNRFALMEGNFVCSNDIVNVEWSRVEVTNLHEYEGSVSDSNGTTIYLTEGVAYRPATEQEEEEYGDFSMDCHLFVSSREKPCVDENGNDGYEECIAMLLVCYSHAFGVITDFSEDCFGCGGEIGGIPDTDPEDPDEPLCF